MSTNRQNGNNDNNDDTTTSSTVSWTTGDTTTTTTTSTNMNHGSSSSSNEHADTSITTFDLHPSTSTNDSNTTTTTTINTAKWTKYLPEAYGIRHSVESSKYRWCARESALWGIATGTTMALHRIRMNSSISRVIHIGFTTVFVVMGGSYYFCVKRRDYQEQMIELLMQLNTFEPVQNMPKERPIDVTHPFVLPIDEDNLNKNDNAKPNVTKQYVAKLPERKEWQSPLPTQDAANIFQPYDNDNNSKEEEK